MTESHHIDTEIAEKTNSRKTTCFRRSPGRNLPPSRHGKAPLWRDDGWQSPGLGIIIFICLLLLGTIVRIYGAWELRHNLDPDSGIVALMAKHMAEGTDFPVFFYGQAYMGSLEPLISAIFCALFGTSGFMVTLGTAFVGWLVMLAVFVWARDAHSPAAGLAAMA